MLESLPSGLDHVAFGTSDLFNLNDLISELYFLLFIKQLPPWNLS